MGRERITLAADDVRSEALLESQIRSGSITPENFATLSTEEQGQVNGLLFKMASDQINPNQGASALEFILMGFIRIMSKKVNGLALTEEEKEIEESLNRITSQHEITNTSLSKENWLFDYMQYAEVKSAEFLRNRQEHIERKKHITGNS